MMVTYISYALCKTRLTFSFPKKIVCMFTPDKERVPGPRLRAVVQGSHGEIYPRVPSASRMFPCRA